MIEDPPDPEEPFTALTVDEEDSLPADTTMVTEAERAAAMWERFRGIRRRYVL